MVLPHVHYVIKGMYEEAIKGSSPATELSRGQSYSLAIEGYALEKSGKHEEARAKLDELLKLSGEGRFVALPPCHLYNAFDDREQTYSWLERGLQERDRRWLFLKSTDS